MREVPKSTGICPVANLFLSAIRTLFNPMFWSFIICSYLYPEVEHPLYCKI